MNAPTFGLRTSTLLPRGDWPMKPWNMFTFANPRFHEPLNVFFCFTDESFTTSSARSISSSRELCPGSLLISDGCGISANHRRMIKRSGCLPIYLDLMARSCLSMCMNGIWHQRLAPVKRCVWIYCGYSIFKTSSEVLEFLNLSTVTVGQMYPVLSSNKWIGTSIQATLILKIPWALVFRVILIVFDSIW